MIKTSAIADHYGSAGMAENVLAALSREGIDVDALSWDQLVAIDQFHTRGLPATREQAILAAPEKGDAIVDFGCGVGGPARFLAAEYGSNVTGIDLTPEYVELAEILSARCGMADQVGFELADVLDVPFADNTFDIGWSQNVSMNIADKTAFYAEVQRVLRSGGRFVTSDVILGAGGETRWPLPWARDPSISFVETGGEVRSAMEAAGFRILDWRDTTADAVSAFQNFNQQARRGKLGVGLIAGADFAERSVNLAQGLAAGAFSSILVLAERIED